MPSNLGTIAAPRHPGARRLWDRLAARRSELGPTLAATVLPFALVFYLALQGGGYDTVVRSEVGIAVWWIVLLGALAGVLPVARLEFRQWIFVGLLTAFAAWSAIAVTWSESEERTVIEVARVAGYIGVLALALAAHPRDCARRIVYSIGTALALIGMIALLSHLRPSWFPTDETRAVFDSDVARLNYPVNYWNGLAALMAIGTPLMLAVALGARRLLVQGLAAAAVPAMALVAFYTLSRGGALEMGAGLLAFLAFHPRRLAALPTLLLTAAGGVLLIAAATQRDALQNGEATQAALDQADGMLATVVVVCVGVALLRIALGLAERHLSVPRPRFSRRAVAASLAVTLVAVGVVALSAGLPGELSERWQEFKQPISAETNESVARFESSSGNGRYQWWGEALDAGAEEPLTGIGPGTFEYYWAREGPIPGFVRDAHSLFLESFAELGVLGFALISIFVLGILGIGASRSLRGRLEERPWLAAAAAAGVAFTVAAAVDWAWELAVLPVCFTLLAAAILSGGQTGERLTARLWERGTLIGLSLAALVAIAIPLAGATTIRASEEEAASQELPEALDYARRGSSIQPWAATPRLQEAMVLELQGDLGGAADAARAATREEPTNWRTWLVLSRIEAFRGNAPASVDAYRRARALNPRSGLFAR